MVALWIDWSLNRIYVEWNQLYPNLIIVLLYGIVNMTITYARGTPVYGFLSWDSVVSWSAGLGMLLLMTAFFAGLYYLTKFKFRKMEMHDSINYVTSSTITIEPDEIEHEDSR